MTRGRGSRSDDGDRAAPALEVIDLEPADETASRRDPATETLRRRRGPAVIAMLVLVALVGVTIAGRSRHSTRSARSSGTGAGHTDINLDERPNGPAPLFPFRVGAQILTGGTSGLRLVDTDTGRVTATRVAGLPPGQATIVAHSGDTVAVRVGFALYWFSTPRTVAHSVAGDTAFPAARSGFLWIAGRRSATEVPGPPNVTLTTGPAIGATGAGLLVSTQAGVLLQPTPDSDGGGSARVLLRAPATVIGVHPDRVAWVSDECGVLRCPVHVTEIASGATASWLQLDGSSSPLAVARASAVFSPDGTHIAIVVPQLTFTTAGTLVVADLRSRATTVNDIGGLFDQPARPGSADPTGMTVDWTTDGRFVLLAPAAGSEPGRVGAAGPTTPFTVALPPTDMGSTVAATGTSTVGSLGVPPSSAPGPIDSGAPTSLNLPGLSLVGADTQRVDVLDLGDNRIRTWPFDGVLPNPAGPHSIARVTGGWLVVRDAIVDYLPDDGGTTRSGAVDAGSEVFSSEHGRSAWIATVLGAQWSVASYEPATGAVGPSTTVGTPVGAVDAGLLVTAPAITGATAFDLLDRSGRLQPGPVLDSTYTDLRILAAAGTQVAFADPFGLELLDIANATTRLVTRRIVRSAALSPDGRNLAWIDDAGGAATNAGVRAMRVGASSSVVLATAANRVFVADDGTVLFTDGVNVRRGRVDEVGSSPVYGLAPDPTSALALG